MVNRAQKSKKGKQPDNRPARARYWRENRLEKHKINNLVRYNGFEDRNEASKYWHSVRQRYHGGYH